MLDVKTKIDLKDLEELTKKYPEESRDARVAKITEGLNLFEREVVKRTPYGAGPIHLRDTIHGEVNVSGKKVEGILGTPMEHGEPVEFGTKPHFPPTGPIQFWVERKLGLSGEEAASAAFGIAMIISGKGKPKKSRKRMSKPGGGTKGAHMFEKGFDEAESRVMKILSEISEDIVKRLR